MRKVFLLILFSLVSNSAVAGWVKVITDSNYDHQSPCTKDCYFIYVDLATITKSGDTVTVWRLNDFSKPEQLINAWLPPSATNSKPHLSVKIQDEFDCREQKLRTLFVSYHSGHMGGGQTIHTDSVHSRWVSIGGMSSDVPVKLIWRAVCERQ
ncbi:MAG: hypothetical protein PHI29_04845 [Gallionella sp.]|nr:hypothetical protein [Gallionella sp.]